jgi:hypothetical protein
MENIGRFKMREFIENCEEMVSHVQDLLNSDENKEWVSRYSKYAEEINANWDKIKNLKKNRFNEWAPLFLYMNVTEAKSRMTFSLRYLGQDVAKLYASSDKITISTKGFEEKNEKYFRCKVSLKDQEWKSKQPANFRSYFSKNPKRIEDDSKKNDEHRIESLFLTNFAKKSSKDKILCNIQPVRIAGIARFQMPTPLYASDIKNIKYAKSAGGGIDILSRIGKSNTTKLCIMELKDENVPKETPAKVILQSLAYATFIRELLRSDSGQEWWKIFGFGGKLPRHLELYVVNVMPFRKNIDEKDRSFADVIIKTGEDSFHLDYIYFHAVDNKLVDIETSLKNCWVREL